MKNFKKIFLLITVFILFIWILNAYLRVSTKRFIYTSLKNVPEIDMIVVPGASVYRSGKLSPILRARVKKGIEFFIHKDSIPILFSGHSTNEGYNEPQAMMTYAIKNKIPPKFILKDAMGSSTYRTLLNCHKDFKAKRILIISQAYHLPRAIYISKSLGLEAYGLVANEKNSSEYDSTPFREITTRVKDFFMVYIFKLFR